MENAKSIRKLVLLVITLLVSYHLLKHLPISDLEGVISYSKALKITVGLGFIAGAWLIYRKLNNKQVK